MYAATYETREKGKFYMYQLLLIEPTAKILDMFASDMIYMIFKNIQDEFIATRSKPGDGTLPTQANESGNPKKPKYVKYVWIGAGAVLVGGVVAYLLVPDGPKITTTDHAFVPPL